MFKQFINAIRKFSGTSSFDMYLESLQQHSGACAPSRSEAKKDFASIVRRGY